MGWAERANPNSRLNRLQADGSYAPYRHRSKVLRFLSAAERAAQQAINKVLAQFRRAA